MLTILKKIFAPPLFEDEDKTRTAAQLNVILWAVILLLAGLTIFRFATGAPLFDQVNIILVALLGMAIISQVIVRQGFVKTASFIFITSSWVLLVYLARNASGIKDTAFVGTIIAILLAGLLLDFRVSIGLTVATILAGWWLATLESQGVLIPESAPALEIARDITVIFSLVAVLSVVTVTGLRNALNRARESADELKKGNEELQEFQTQLEQRVTERTTELETISLAMQKRADQLATVSNISKAIASVQEIDALLDSVTSIISDRFGYYHTGIFLPDETGVFAVLKATNSEGGKRMLEREHKLRIGVQGIVGYVIFTGQPRIALDTGADSVFFDNPDLPSTRSEMAVPLSIGKKVIGALDVQSEQPDAFSEEDISILSTLANQVAIAIENARLFTETRTALEQARAAYRKFVQLGWNQIANRAPNIGYQFQSGKFEPILSPLDRPEITKAVKEKKPVVLKIDNKNVLAVPMELHGQIVGVLNLRPIDNDRQWSAEDLVTAQSIAERATLAIENARLIDDSQRRASTERTISEMSAKIGSSTQIETILRTAAEELSRNLMGSEVLIQIQPEIGEKPEQSPTNDKSRHEY
jgi:GAF domain-containing protein